MCECDIIDTALAARRKRVSRQAILDAIRRGAIDGQQVGRYYVVFENERFKQWTSKKDGSEEGPVVSR